MDKSPDAFRTISEVADWLGVPTHVLRFWESRFSQVKPVKRAGGRRYYRPADMVLLGGIKRLLHDEGMTIRGVQKMLREDGVRHVSSFSQPLDADGPDALHDVSAAERPTPMAVDVEPEPMTDNVVPLVPAQPAPTAARPDEAPAPEAEPPVPASEAEAAADPEAAPNEPQPLILRRTAPVAPADLPDDGPAAGAEAEAPPPPDGGVAADPAADVPGEVRAADEEEHMPEFSFLRHRTRSLVPPPVQPDLFGAPADERAGPPTLPASETEPEAPVPQPRDARPIPATPEVPAADAADDDPSAPARPGMAARLATGRLVADHAVVAGVVADLRDLRARL